MGFRFAMSGTLSAFTANAFPRFSTSLPTQSAKGHTEPTWSWWGCKLGRHPYRANDRAVAGDEITSCVRRPGPVEIHISCYSHNQ